MVSGARVENKWHFPMLSYCAALELCALFVIAQLQGSEYNCIPASYCRLRGRVGHFARCHNLQSLPSGPGFGGGRQRNVHAL
jgi:hypothetical protein